MPKTDTTENIRVALEIFSKHSDLFLNALLQAAERGQLSIMHGAEPDMD